MAEAVAKTNDLLALLVSREAHGLPPPAALEQLVQPLVARRMGRWLLEAGLAVVAAELAQRAAPRFWRDVAGREEDAAAVLAAARALTAEVDCFAGRLQALAAAAGAAPAEPWSALDAVLPLLWEPDAPELAALLRACARASFAGAGHDTELARELGRLGLGAGLAEAAAAAAEDELERRLAAAARQWDVAALGPLLQWADEEARPWALRLLGPAAGGAVRVRVQRETLRRFCRLRSSELFDIVVGFPEDTLAAAQDLKDALGQLAAADGAGAAAREALEELQRLLGASLRARLLHAGAPTADILRTYTLCIHVLRLVDPSGVTLDRVSGPVRAYLVQRPDTIRCVVQALTDPTSDLFAELCKAPTEPGALRGPAGSDAAEDWTPEPADALPQGEGVSRHKDLVELLVKIFGGSEAFVGEFKTLLSQRLLGPAADYEAELRTLELLKLRFGEAALADCEIMLRDVADSRRVTKLCAAEGEAPLAALVLSHLYWPALPAALPLTPAPALHALLERFQASFAERKASRRLAWHLGLGEVALEVKLPSGRFLDFEGLSFLQATLLQLLREQPHWTAEGLVARTGLTAAPGGPEAVRRGLQFWAGAGLAREDPLGHWALREDEAGVRADGGTGAAEAMEESEEEGEEDLAVAEPFVLHMLNNLGPLALPQIQDQLRSFAEIDRPLPVLREFLAAMVASEKLLLKDGLYSSIGK